MATDRNTKSFSLVSFVEGELKGRIEVLQKTLFEITGSRKSLDDWQPHITIGDGLVIASKELRRTEEVISSFAKERSPFCVRLNGSGGKTDRKGGVGELTTPFVLWINVSVNPSLRELVKSLTEKISVNYDLWYEMPKPYVPHVTLAFRDLTEEGYEKGAKYLESVNFEEKMEVTHISLVEKTLDSDDEYKRFMFNNG